MFKRKVVCIIFFGISLLFCACGRTEEFLSSVPTESHPVAVAEFCDWDVQMPREGFWKYTLTKTNFYALCPKYDVKTNTQTWRVIRNGLFREYDPEDHIEGTGDIPLAMLADSGNHIFLFRRKDEDFILEKYDTDGGILWEKIYTGEELQGMGERLREGVVTEEGLVFLYAQGTGGCIASFGKEGDFQELYTPNLPSLDGISVGKAGAVYAYCISDGTALLMEIEGMENGGGDTKNFPFTPLKVWSGYEEGLFLHTGEGLWKYDTASEESEMLWRWDEEYIQADPERLESLYCEGDKAMFLGVRFFPGSSVRGQIETVRIGFEDSADYPGKQTITLGRAYNLNSITRIEELVRLYNRQSREYQVEILQYDEDSRYDYSPEAAEQLERQFITGEGPDVMEVSLMYADRLAAKGAFEDLTDYYRRSEKVREEELLDPIRRAARVSGRNVYVIPFFYIGSMFSREKTEPEDWTPQKFLEAALERQVLSQQSRISVFTHCMGVRYGEHFVDYEKGESYFNSREFMEILENCAKVREINPEGSRGGGEALLTDISIRSPFAFANASEIYGEGKYWLGYPGWDGAETALYPYDVFVINNASPQKEGAWDFLEFLLSRDLQDAAGLYWSGFPARKDSFEAQLQSYTDWEVAEEYGNGVSRAPLSEADAEVLRDQVDRAVYQSFGSRFALRQIVWEEAEMYLAGDAGLEETVEKIQSRVKLYLEE